MTIDSTLNFALLGCGRIGVMHAGILAHLETTNLVCVYDIVADSATAVATKHNANVASSASAAITDPNVEAVLIATSTDTHADYIKMAAEAGKAILCEKPIDLSLARVKDCQQTLAAHPVPIQIGFNRRFDPGHAAARQALVDGEIGDLLHIIITSRDPEMPPRSYYEVAGGLLRDMTIHDFDLARFFLGEEPTEVFAVAGRLCDPTLMDELDDHDSAMIILRTASGKLCHINNTRAAVYGYDQRVELHGNQGMLLSSNKHIHQLEKSTAHHTAARQPLQFFFIDRYLQSYEIEVSAFVAAVREGKDPPVSLADGRRALELAEAAYQSVASGKMVAIPPA